MEDHDEGPDPAMRYELLTPAEQEAMQDITQRLRGVYAVPIRDGAGLLNGGNTAIRTMPVGPIQIRAADLIEQYRSTIVKMRDLIWKMQEAGARVPDDPPLDDDDCLILASLLPR